MTYDLYTYNILSEAIKNFKHFFGYAVEEFFDQHIKISQIKIREEMSKRNYQSTTSCDVTAVITHFILTTLTKSLKSTINYSSCL